MADHAKFSPSKMQRIIACPGSIALESRIPDSRSSYADEGTVAHDIAARCLRKGGQAFEFIGMEADVTPTGEVIWVNPFEKKGKFKIDESFADSVQVYVDSVRRRAHGKILLVEQRVEFSKAIGIANQFGTSDAIIIDMEEACLDVGDLKFGMGVKVYASETIANPQFPSETIVVGNEQALSYAVGVVETLGDLLPKIKKVRVFISQPRLDHEDEFECTMADVEAHAARMRNAALVATVALKDYEADRDLIPAYFKAGDKQCRFCKAKAWCPTLSAFVSDNVFDDFKVLEDPAKIQAADCKQPTVSTIAARYAALPLIQEWCAAVGAEVNRMVRAGMEIIGPDNERMKMVEGRKGDRAWVDAEKAEALLAGKMPIEKLYKPKEIVTPTKVGEYFGEKRKKPSPELENIKTLWKRAPGQPQVALGSDPRPAWTGEAKIEEMADLSDSVIE